MTVCTYAARAKWFCTAACPVLPLGTKDALEALEIFFSALRFAFFAFFLAFFAFFFAFLANRFNVLDLTFLAFLANLRAVLASFLALLLVLLALISAFMAFLPSFLAFFFSLLFFDVFVDFLDALQFFIVLHFSTTVLVTERSCWGTTVRRLGSIWGLAAQGQGDVLVIAHPHTVDLGAGGVQGHGLQPQDAGLTLPTMAFTILVWQGQTLHPHVCFLVRVTATAVTLIFFSHEHLGVEHGHFGLGAAQGHTLQPHVFFTITTGVLHGQGLQPHEDDAVVAAVVATLAGNVALPRGDFEAAENPMIFGLIVLPKAPAMRGEQKPTAFSEVDHKQQQTEASYSQMMRSLPLKLKELPP